MRNYLKENTPAAPAAVQPPPAAPAATGNQQTSLSASGKKLQDRLAKIPGLDKLMSTVTKRDDAAEILAAIAEKLGGDKVKGSQALTNALKIAKEEEKENPQQQAVQKESIKRTEAFVRYLFE